MLADEFKLALRHMSILETEAIKNRYELKLDCFTYGIVFTGLHCYFSCHLTNKRVEQEVD